VAKPDHEKSDSQAVPAPDTPVEATGKAGRQPRADWRESLRAWFEDEKAAWAFLTILPIPDAPAPVWPRMVRVFPWVGALIGAISAAAMLIVRLMGFSEHLAALLAVLTGLVMTGAMHEDGLADFADSLGGCSREDRLRIMRDPGTGAFGVLALLFLAVAAPVFSLAAIIEARGLAAAMLALVSAHAVSRAGMVWQLASLPPAKEEGQGAGAGRPAESELRVALVTATVIAAVLLVPVWAPMPLLGAALAGLWSVAFIGWLARRLVGGQTGDVLGATEVMVRALFLLMLSPHPLFLV